MTEQPTLEHDLVRKTLRSLTMERRTLEEIQHNYTQLFPPLFLFRNTQSVSLANLKRALTFLVREGYVSEEVTRYLERPLKRDTKVYCLSGKGMSYLSKKK